VRIRVAVAARQRLWLLLGVVSMALSLLVMHHLSSDHTAAGSPAGPSPAASAHLTSASHIDLHDDTVGADHAHLTASTGEGHPLSEIGGCSGCADHSALGLTCLAALLLLMSGFKLIRPAAGRGLWLRVPLPLTFVQSRAWLLRPRTLVELAVSRT